VNNFLHEQDSSPDIEHFERYLHDQLKKRREEEVAEVESIIKDEDLIEDNYGIEHTHSRVIERDRSVVEEKTTPPKVTLGKAELAAVATKIQSHIRGFLTRQVYRRWMSKNTKSETLEVLKIFGLTYQDHNTGELLYFKVKIQIMKDKNLLKITLASVNNRQLSTVIEKLPEEFDSMCSAG
jgi:hypothetical protein